MALRQRGITKAEAAELEVWEVAAHLGMAGAPKPEPQRDLVAERLYAHEHGLPQPKYVPPPRRDPPVAPTMSAETVTGTNGA